MLAFVVGCGADATDATLPDGILYGPGPHWIREVETGVLTFSARTTVDLDVDGDGQSDAELMLAGTTTVWRSSAYASEPGGAADRIDLEIVDMRLEGDGVRLRGGDGVGNGARDGALFSIGESVERRDAPARADDLFSIFFELELDGGGLRNAAPLLVASTIEYLPPLGTRFRLVGAPVEMLDGEGAPTGLRVIAVDYEVLERIS